MPWRLIVAQGNVPITQTLGAVAREADIEALLVPSAKYAGSTNVAIIRDRLREGSNFSIHKPDGFPSAPRPSFVEHIARAAQAGKGSVGPENIVCADHAPVPTDERVFSLESLWRATSQKI